MESVNSVKIVDVCRVAPRAAADSAECPTELSIPLPYPDLMWLRFPPVERLYFYKLTHSSSSSLSPSHFHSLILPKLKHSLSAVLLSFLPVSGRLTWPPLSPKPTIFFSSNDDAVSVTVAVSSADFDCLSGNGPRDSAELHPYVPVLPASERESSILSIQITLFPYKGFSIGYAVHHAALDGKSSTMFMKAWAFTCKNHGIGLGSENFPELSPELSPFLDRTAVKDPLGFDVLFLKIWEDITESETRLCYSTTNNNNARSLKPLLDIGVNDIVLSAFQLSREEINKLKKKVLSEAQTHLHLSTFVTVCAYVLVCIGRAKAFNNDNCDDVDSRKVHFVFSVDCRARLDPPLPTNYFGNCVGSCDLMVCESELMAEKAVTVVAERISEKIKGLEEREGPFERVEKVLSKLKDPDGVPLIGVAGSTRFGVYETDFGWGSPEKVEVTSIARTGAISLAESRDGSGGVEVGLALKRQEMDAFASLFANGLKN